MKMHKEVAISERKLKEAIDEGVGNLSDENLLLVDKLGQLERTLAKLKQAEINGLDIAVKFFENQLKSFDGLIDKKYYNVDALKYIILIISCGVVNTLNEAITEYERFNKTIK